MLNNPLTAFTAAIKEISGQETDEGEQSEAKKYTPPNQTTDEEGALDQSKTTEGIAVG